MRRLLATTSVFLWLLAGPAFGQSSSQSDASAAANSGSQSGAASTVVIDQSSRANSNDSNVNIDRTPDVSAPGLGTAGTSPCLIATSLGIGVTGFGLSAGSGHVDEGCEQRNMAALLANLGFKEAARAYLCDVDERVAAAFKSIGAPCGEKIERSMSAVPIPPVPAMPAPPTQQEIDQAKAEILLEIFREIDRQ
jgi:hypothetical protein